MTFYYTYYSYEEWGRGYIGRRTCECLPEEDNYFGSYHDKTFYPTQKIILEVYASYEESIDAEITLHNFYQVDINPHFANKAKQKSNGFSYRGTGKNNPNYGNKWTDEMKEKLSQKKLGTKRSSSAIEKTAERNRGQKRSSKFREEQKQRFLGENNPNYGKKHSEEWRQNHSEQMRGENNPSKRPEVRSKLSDSLSGESNPMHGKKHSEESKRKMSESAKNRKQSPEQIRKRVEATQRTKLMKKNCLINKENSKEIL